MPFENKFGKSSDAMCGLVFYLSDLKLASDEASDEAVPVPLKDVSINANIVGFVSEITVTQSYTNVEDKPIEVVYMFPIEEEAAVTSFEAEVDGRKIHTEVKEKEKARKDYDEAVENRKTAVLLEETQPDIFQIKLGQLKPGAGATISIKYIGELPVDDSNVKLTIPTTIAPRYVPSTDMSESASKIASIPYSKDKPAPLSINFSGLSQVKIKSIRSPSHDFKTTLGDNKNSDGQYTFSGELAANTTDMNRDVIVYIESEDNDELNQPVVFLEKPDEGDVEKGLVGMVSLVPSFKLKDQLTELIFLVDRSGSMYGGSISQAKKALELFLHSLPSDCYFNIWSFGSSYDCLFREASAKLSDHSLSEAIQHVKSLDANYGGTEIYDPLKAIFEQPRFDGYLRQVFVLTDGSVSNASMVNSLVKAKNDQGRVFSLGLGSGASRYLVKGIARAGGGTAVFANEDEDLRLKVMGQLKNALQPALSNIKISWDENMPVQGSDTTEPMEVETKRTLLGFMKRKKSKDKKTSNGDAKAIIQKQFGQVPSKVSPLFDGTRLLVYHLYHKGCNEPKIITISAETPDGPLSVDVDIINTNILEGGDFVRKLAARKKIQELEESNADNEYGYEEDNETSKELKDAIITLGIENSLASKHTSFIGIDDKTKSALTEKPMLTREIKNQVPRNYGGYYGGSAGGMAFGSGYRSVPPPPGAGPPPGAPMQSRSLRSAPMRRRGRSRSRSRSRDRKSRSRDREMNVSNGRDEGMDVEKCISFGSDSSDEDDEIAEDSCCKASIGNNKVNSMKSLDEQMTALVGLQRFKGNFEISSNNWQDSVFQMYTGTYENVNSNCPKGVGLGDWLTALAMKILEIKMDEKKELWELVVQKSKKYLIAKLMNNEEEYNVLLGNAEEFIKNK